MGIPMELQEWVPYIIVLGAAAAILLLLGARRRLLANAAPDKPGVPIGNGQTIGARDEQDDYFSSVTTPHGTAAVLADGISGLAHGRLASTIAVTVFIREFLKLSDIRTFMIISRRRPRSAIRRFCSNCRALPGERPSSPASLPGTGCIGPPSGTVSSWCSGTGSSSG